MAKSKKELDKDVMYSKIMPSAFLTPDEDEPLPPKPEPAPPKDELSNLRDKLFSRPQSSAVGASMQNIPVNLMEFAVAQRLEEAFSKFNCCKCDRCKRDVAAIALNKLSPHYVVAPPEQLEALSATIPSRDVAAALIQAILKVRAEPRH